MVTLNMHASTHGIPGYLHADKMKRLVFLDGSGRVLLLLPNYGWNIPSLEDWAHEQNLDTEITMAWFGGDELDRFKAFPGYNQAPSAPVGKPFFVPTPRVPLAEKLRRTLGLTKD